MKWAKIDVDIIDFRVDNLISLSPLEASEIAIKSIIDNFPPPYHLMLSGGIDSQAMLYAWKLFGSDYISTSVIYNNDYNLYDLDNLKKFCDLYNIEIKYLHFNLLNFLFLEYDKFSEQIRCSSPCISAYAKMTEQLTGTVLFSGNFLHPKGATLSDAVLGLYRYSIKRPTIIPYFFLYTPELAYSLINDNNLYKELNFKYLDDYQQKVFLYQRSGFPVIPQEKKLSGFEKIKDFYDENFYHLVSHNNRLLFSSKQSNRTFDLLYRYPYEKKYQDKQIRYIMNNTLKDTNGEKFF